jgi:hypothetical protein
LTNLTYKEAMGEDGAHVRLKLDTEQPIALDSFVGSFVGIGNQFEKFVAREHPGIKMDGEFFVKEVRAGCVEADLIAVVGPVLVGTALPGIIDAIDKAQILQKFVQDLSSRIGKYFTPGGRDERASRSDLSDYHKTIGAIVGDPNASARIESAEYVDDQRKISSIFRFTAENARSAQKQIADHRAEMDGTTASDHSRVLLQFVRPSVETGKPGRKSGERGIIAKIHHRALPIVYASDMAEQRIRSEFLEEGNVFKRLFDVDVNVELNSSGKPKAFRIVHVHAVVDDVDEDDLEA